LGKSQRTKGATYEREVARRFTDAIGLDGVEIKRNIGQARDGGNDIDVGPYVVECKRRKTLTTIEQWFAQAVVAAAARKPGPYGPAIPIVVMRADHGSDYVVIRLNDFLAEQRDALRDFYLEVDELEGDE
jgi:hypothetical protein